VSESVPSRSEGASCLLAHWRRCRAYWFPWNLVFVQNGRQYTVTTNNMLSGFKGLFSGRVYTELDGFVRVPDGINYSYPFDIWYDEEKATLGPIS